VKRKTEQKNKDRYEDRTVDAMMQEVEMLTSENYQKIQEMNVG
jgi:hypothetical protein